MSSCVFCLHRCPKKKNDFEIQQIEWGWQTLGFAIVSEKKRNHPWDTHSGYQFSIKTLLSKAITGWRSSLVALTRIVYV